MPADRNGLNRLIESLGDGARGAEPHLVVESIVRPSTFRDGLVDRRIVTGGDIVRRVSFGYNLDAPPGEDPSRYVCLLRPANHRVIAGLEVRSGSGRRLQVCSPQATARVIAQAMWMRLEDLETLETHPDGQQLRSTVVRRLLELVRDSSSQTVRAHREAIDNIQKATTAQARELLDGVNGLPDATDRQSSLAELVGVAAARQPLLAQVPPGEQGLLSYTMRESVGETLGLRKRWRHRLANAIGAVPSELRIPLYKGTQSVLVQDIGDTCLKT